MIAPVEGAWVPFDTTLLFDWPSMPLSLNQRLHWAQKAKLTAQVKAEVVAAAWRIPELGRCRVTFIWVVTDRRRRDEDNPVLTKVCCDALVAVGVVRDDVAKYMERSGPHIEWRDKKQGHTAHVELRVERIP